jgi:hypothetical protein
MFVGPSPGGHPDEPVETERNPKGRNPKGGILLWNEPFTEPYDEENPNYWGGKYKYSIPILVETILGISLDKGGNKLYGFANFDWVPCPNEREVLEERMRQGEGDVLRVLENCEARVIIPVTKLAHKHLCNVLGSYYNIQPILCSSHLDKGVKSLRFHYEIQPIQCKKCNIQMPSDRFHREMDILRILSRKIQGTRDGQDLSGAVVIRCPQHPNRFENKAHAWACAQAIRAVLDALERGEEIEIEITCQQCKAPLR